MKIILSVSLLTLAMTVGHGCGSAPANNTSMDHNSMPGMDHNSMPGMNHSSMQSSPNAASAAYDLQFLDTMIAHHQGAVDMAGPCSTKAQHAELKTLCSNIISSQTKEITDMRSWRDKWFPGAAPAINMQLAGMEDSMKGMDMAKLSSLTGSSYDLEFINEMIPHHDGAVIMAGIALRQTAHTEIKDLAANIIRAQQMEIGQMKNWQKAWNK
ncbi:MAG: DUF305 domain-containing protein [Acidobacteria bacterium]|nr:DUF305 domain-containing protein [Acidobacteriota bacterium]